jgi:hypothetical protein
MRLRATAPNHVWSYVPWGFPSVTLSFLYQRRLWQQDPHHVRPHSALDYKTTSTPNPSTQNHAESTHVAAIIYYKSLS